MSTCERCWADAHRGGPYANVPEAYQRLMRERSGDGRCTPEQQAGPDAAPCGQCGGRLVRHQHTGECMVDPRHTAPEARASHPAKEIAR